MKKNCSVMEKLFGEMFEFLQFSRRKLFFLHLVHDVKINIFERNNSGL